jgi:5'-3' exonuclease
MGIPGIFNVIARKRRGLAREIRAEAFGRETFAAALRGAHSDPRARVRSLCFDFNALVHECIREGGAGEGDGDGHAGWERIVERAAAELDRIVDAVAPEGPVFLAADGVAPVAKMVQQRERRFRAASRPRAPGVFDRNRITPGTDFARLMDARFAEHCSARPGYIYSGTGVPGEGEHKIAERLDEARRSRGSEGAPGEEAGGAVDVVYGADADMYVIMAVRGLEFSVLRRSQCGSELTLVNAPRIVEAAFNSPDNFAVAMCLLGNDFLPPISCLRVSDAWLARLDALSRDLALLTRGPDGRALGVDRAALGALAARLAETEDSDFRSADADYWSRDPPRRGDRESEEDWEADNYPLLNKDPLFRSIRPGTPGWRMRMYRVWGRDSVAVDGWGRARDFADGVSWVVGYYSGRISCSGGDGPGEARVPSWFYPHFCPPSDMASVLSAAQPAAGGAERAAGVDGTLLVGPGEALAFVMPLGWEGVPRDYLHPRTARTSTYLCRKAWHCRTLLPLPVSLGDIAARGGEEGGGAAA